MLLLALAVGALTDAVRAQQPCAAGAERVPTLGITSLASAGSFSRQGARGTTEFDSEPQILAVGIGTPADGALEEGDWIVAIDGHLITTSAGGDRFASFSPGERVRLRIRRNGTIRDVALVAGWYCRAQASPSRGASLPDGVSTAASERLPNLLPEGWLGIALECAADCRMVIARAADGRPSYRFHRQPPAVSAVAPDSPAARAGLEPGDVILEIDGQSILTEAGGEAYSSIRPGQAIQLRIDRGGELQTVTVSVGRRGD
jgi:S1-C subfamily serine protease